MTVAWKRCWRRCFRRVEPGIYVFHVPILGFAQIYVFPRIVRSISSLGDAIFTEYAYIVVLAGVTFAVSAFSYELFEKKILRFKRYFEPKYTQPDEETTAEPAIAQEAAG